MTTLRENGFLDDTAMNEMAIEVSSDNELCLFEDDPDFFDDADSLQEFAQRNHSFDSKCGEISSKNVCFMSKSIINLVSQIFKCPISDETLKNNISFPTPKIPFLSIRSRDQWLKAFNPNVVPECLESEVFTERFMGDFLKVAFPLISLLDLMSKGRLPLAKVEASVIDSLLLLSSALEKVNDWRRENIINRYNLSHLDVPDVSPFDRTSLFPSSFEKSAKFPPQSEVYQESNSVPDLKLNPVCKFPNDILNGQSTLESTGEKIQKIVSENKRRQNMAKDAFTQTLDNNKTQNQSKHSLSVGCQVSSSCICDMVPSRENPLSLEETQNNLKRKGSDDMVSPVDSKRISLNESGNFGKMGNTSAKSIEVKVLENNSAKLKVVSNDVSSELIEPKLGQSNLGVLSKGDDKKLSPIEESADGSSSEKDYYLSISNDNDTSKNQVDSLIVTSPLRGESSLESGISIEESIDDSDEEIEPGKYFGDLTSSRTLTIDASDISENQQTEASKASEGHSNSNTTNIEKQDDVVESPEKEEPEFSLHLGSKPVTAVDSTHVDQTSSDNSKISNVPPTKKRQRYQRKKMVKNNLGNSQPANISNSKLQNISQQPLKRGVVALLGDKPMVVNNTRLVTQQNIPFNDVRQSQNFMLQERKISTPPSYRDDARIFASQMTFNGMRGASIASQLIRSNERIVRTAFPQTQITQHSRSLRFDTPLEIPSFSTPIFDSRGIVGRSSQFDPRRSQPTRGNPYLRGRR